MIRTALIAAVLGGLLLAGCERNGPATQTGPDGDRLAALEQRVDRIDKRLQRIEQFLERAVGGIPNEPDPNAVYAVPVSPLDPIVGPPKAAVTVIEGFEFA